MALVKDVVCGMQIESAAAAATSDYKGTTYYFCAAGCKSTFDADPEKYLTGAAPSAADKRWWEFWKS